MQRETDADLAQKLANPVSSLISVPLQFNYDCCMGPDDSGRYLLNVQPVVPLTLNDDWNLIIRTILPVISQDIGFGDQSGLGDTTQSFFFSPQTGSKTIWAIGPVFYYPTGTDGFSGAKWGAGPTALVLKEAEGGTTYGVLANHVWSFAGAESHADISSTFIQPFFSHTFPNATGLSVNAETSYDWEHDQWTVPVNVGVNHVYKFGGQRVQLGLGGRVYLEGPDDGPDWGLRFTTTFLFPKG